MISEIREEILFIIDKMKKKEKKMTYYDFENYIFELTEKKIYIKKLLKTEDLKNNDELELNKMLNLLMDQIEEMKLIRSMLKKRLRKKTTIIVTIIQIIVLLLVLNNSINMNNKYYSKEKTQGIILQAIKNNVETKDLTSILKTKNENLRNLSFFYSKKDESYKEPLSLETILIDIRNNNSLKAKSEYDKDLNNNIKKRLEEFQQISPFDKLNKNQIDNFTNIRTKLKNDDYLKIKNDLLKIVDDLSFNTKLINIYLAQSDKSYVMTIIALVLSILSFIPLLINFSQMGYNYFKKIIHKKN